MRALVERGSTVVGGGAAGDGYDEAIGKLGVRFKSLPIDQGGMNPFADLRLLVTLYLWYRAEGPDVVHHFTIKPVIYGSIAAYLAGVPKVVNTISGLGYVYARRGGLLRKLVNVLYRIGLRRATHVFFQNEEDRQLFVDTGIARPECTSVVPGSGVDLARFRFERAIDTNAPRNVVVLIVARLLKDKGIGEFVEAARAVRSLRGGITFRIMGGIDSSSPSAIKKEDLDGWVRNGIVEWLGHRDDVRPVLQEADIVVLPSYYPEGTPRSLLEAAAMGKPIVTTDTVGCRNVVENGINGFLVPARDVKTLADAILELSNSTELRRQMGQAGRRKMEREYDERIVIDKTVAVYEGNSGS